MCNKKQIADLTVELEALKRRITLLENPPLIMRKKTKPDGTVVTSDAQRGYLHSFGGEPAIVRPDGEKLWYDRGYLVQAVVPEPTAEPPPAKMTDKECIELCKEAISILCRLDEYPSERGDALARARCLIWDVIESYEKE